MGGDFIYLTWPLHNNALYKPIENTAPHKKSYSVKFTREKTALAFIFFFFQSYFRVISICARLLLMYWLFDPSTLTLSAVYFVCVCVFNLQHIPAQASSIFLIYESNWACFPMSGTTFDFQPLTHPVLGNWSENWRAAFKHMAPGLFFPAGWKLIMYWPPSQ